MKNLIQQFLEDPEVKGQLSIKTRKAYLHDLDKFNESIDKPIEETAKEDIKSFIELLRLKNNSECAIARKISSLRSFFNYLKMEGTVEETPLSSIKTPKIKIKEPTFLSTDELQSLLKTIYEIATPYYRLRDLAIAKIFLSTGIRLKELCGLKTMDIDLEEKRMKITRKGGNEQLIPLREDVCNIIKKYLKTRPENEQGSLFISRKGNGISSSTVYYLIKKYLKASGIKKDKVGVHSLRHTVATGLREKGVDIWTIQKLLGHKSITSTQRYMHVGDKELVSAVNQLSL